MDDVIDREFRYVPHEDKLYSRLVMSTDIRAARLEQNKRMRNETPTRDLSWARWTMSIPQLDWYYLCKKYPDLASQDKHTREAALAKFMASSESAPYKVRDEKAKTYQAATRPNGAADRRGSAQARPGHHLPT